MTLIETIVGIFIMLLVFLSIFGSFRLAIELVYNTKAKTGAVALITEQMEYVRARTYDAVGTIGGIPAGSIPQSQQKTLNNILYTIRTLIQYVDAPEDGLGAADTNNVTADYKSIKVEVTWSVHGKPRSTFAVTRISPHGVETLGSGGTLRVEAFNALAAFISGATVRIENAGAVPAVDVSASTDSSGAVLFPGTPPAAGYHITVTKTGYSSSTTYAQTPENPDPDPGNIAVANTQTTTASFGIDVVSTVRVLSFEPVGPGSFEDLFADQSKLFATSSVAVLNGVLELELVESSYAPLGSAVSIPVAPPYLVSWSTFTWNATTSPNTALSVRLYYYDGASYVLIPDNVLAGNSAGYSGGVIDISTLPAAAYGSLQAEAALSTTDTAETPTLLEWKFAYTAGPTPLPNVAFDIHGAKTIGTASNGTPLYKYMGRYTTSASGEKLFDPVEWDIYTLSLPSGSPYTTVERCPFVVSVIPNEQKSVSVTLDDDTAGSLLMYVSGGGAPVLNADVTIVGGSINNAQTTSSCGQVFLGGMAATTYTVTISAPGYEPYSEDVAVSGTTELSVSLNPNP